MTTTRFVPPACAAPDRNPAPSGLILPAQACDCHAHIFDPRESHVLIRDRTYTPAEASLDDYRTMMGTLGLERAVLVQPSVYGTDNRPTLDAVRSGGENFRAVVVVDDNVSPAQLKALNNCGTRGVRINLLFKSNAVIGNLRRLANSIAEFGWHLQLLADISSIPDLWGTLRSLPVDVVFDHFGHLSTTLGTGNRGFQNLQSLLADGRCWVKLSGAYRITSESTPPYADVAPFAREIIDCNPERVLWGSDWPHPHIPVPMPNDGALLDMLGDWAPDESIRHRILVTNPATLYGF